MNAEELMDELAQAHPKAIDFPETVFSAIPDATGIANALGYRVAGVRLGQVVLTTKVLE